NTNGDITLGANHIAVNLNGDTTRPLAKIKENEINDKYGASAGTYNFGNGTSNGNTAPAKGSEKTYYSWVDYDGKSKTLYVRSSADSSLRPDKAVLTQK